MTTVATPAARPAEPGRGVGGILLAAIRNADEIHPVWQTLAVGDLMRTHRPLPRFEPLGWFVAGDRRTIESVVPAPI